MDSPVRTGVRRIGRYALHDEIAAGGMATVHFGRLVGQAGFARTVAIKRLHPQYAKDPDFVSMFLDEARLAARIHHPNVVATLDVVAREGELFVVMEYVHGEALSSLIRKAAQRGETVAPRIGAGIVAGFLHGLHAAHDARNERGEPLDLVHRDVSPQNVLVGVDGVPRIVDFGVAKAAGRVQTTREGEIKGKLAYMAPEQIHGAEVSRRTDVYAAGIVLWEVLTGKRLFARDSEAAVMLAVMSTTPVAPSAVAPELPTAFDRIALRALARAPEARFASAREMALAIEDAVDVALPSEIGAWVQSVAAPTLAKRAARVAEIEGGMGEQVAAPSDAPKTDSEPALPVPERTRTGSTPIATIDATRAAPVNARRRRQRAAGLAAAALGLVGLVAVAFVVGRRSEPTPVVPTAAAAAAPPATSPPEPAATPSPPPPPEPAPAPEPPAAAAPSASIASAPSPSGPQSPAVPARRAQKRPAAGACDPPYRVDPSGRKIFKLECL